MCLNRSTRCHGFPDRDSSWVSSGNLTITAVRCRYFSARNICSPPIGGGVRMSDSPSINISGVVTFATYVIGDSSSNCFGFSHGAAENHVGLNSVKSAAYQNPDQSAMERCDTAAAKRLVWVTIQLVSTPPPLPPVAPIFVESMYPRFTTASTPAIRSL